MIVKPQPACEENDFLTAAETAGANDRDVGTAGPSNLAGGEEKAGQQRMVTRLRRLWSRRQIVSRWTVVGLVLSAVIAFLIPRRYESSAHLMPPDQASSGAGMAMLAAAGSTAGSSLGTLAGGILGLKSSGALFIGILQSRTVQDDIVDRFQLQKIYGDRYEENARKDLARNSDVFEDRKSGIITIQVTDADPKRATAMAQEYTDELNRVVNQMSTSAAHREREFLEDRLKNVQVDLEAAEREFSQFSSKNGAIDIQAQGKAMIEGAATLQGELIAAQSELQGLKQIYTDDNVRVRSLRAQMAELKNQLNRVSGKNEDAGASAEATPADPNYPTIRKLPLLGVAYGDLYRRTKIQEAVFETLTREYELAKVQEVKETPSVKVLDPASIPQERSFPPRLLIILLGTLAAFLAGMIWLLLSALWDEIDLEDPRRAFALEVYQGAMAKIPLRALGGSLAGLTRRAAWGRASERPGISHEHD
jgi:capsule polysaccharide export protein KpsE/RkpR